EEVTTGSVLLCAIRREVAQISNAFDKLARVSTDAAHDAAKNWCQGRNEIILCEARNVRVLLVECC
ncbi:hypothetical protein, partial [Burkholderia vietnamiensis]